METKSWRWTTPPQPQCKWRYFFIFSSTTRRNFFSHLPASTSNTFHCGTSDRRDATTAPPVPPPTTIKSYSMSGAARDCGQRNVKRWVKKLAKFKIHFQRSSVLLFSRKIPVADDTDPLDRTATEWRPPADPWTAWTDPLRRHWPELVR